MRVLLTGGAGDLGTVLTPALEHRGATSVRLDIVPPADHAARAEWVNDTQEGGIQQWSHQ